MTTYYYSLDIEIIGTTGYEATENIDKVAIRTIPIKESVSIKGKPEIIRDNFTEEYFEENKEQLASKAVTDYNKTHKSQVGKIVGIRRTPILE